MARKPILMILHRRLGSTGKIGKLLADKGHRLDVRCIIEGDTLPDPNDYAAVIVFGGMMSANDCQLIPAIAKEIAWIPTVVTAKIPYLGICLGAQLLARALGGGVGGKDDESVEIGFHQVRPTSRDSELLPDTGIRFYHWHIEGFSIPDSCERLAESDNFPNQAFRHNSRTIGLQFHPEATREMIDAWVRREPENLSLKGAQSYKTQVELFRESDAQITQWLDDFLAKWLVA